MFTIKQVCKSLTSDRSLDRVRLWEGYNIEFGLSETTQPKPQVSFQSPDGCHCTVDAGVIFVLNAAGKTVDTFRLEGSDWY